MKGRKISINKACSATAVFFAVISVVTIIILYYLTGMPKVILCDLLFIILVFSSTTFLIVIIRSKLTLFSDSICKTLDDMFLGKKTLQVVEEESLFYKIYHRLDRLYDIMQENHYSVEKERNDLKELISDISHQVKTPIANLKMLNATLLEQDVPLDKQRDFLKSMDGQLEKLNFLMQAMIKTSRLETGIITFEKKKQPIYDTLATALGEVIFGAEKKDINIEVDCQENMLITHDRKWTCEAIFNVLDNAVKYTPRGGNIQVSVKCLEMYLRIDVTDTGKGISEESQGAIFKRFYREKDVHEIEGLGIGLYLTRYIITMQGGYVCVSSELGYGSRFSIFLPMI